MLVRIYLNKLIFYCDGVRWESLKLNLNRKVGGSIKKGEKQRNYLKIFYNVSISIFFFNSNFSNSLIFVIVYRLEDRQKIRLFFNVNFFYFVIVIGNFILRFLRLIVDLLRRSGSKVCVILQEIKKAGVLILFLLFLYGFFIDILN